MINRLLYPVVGAMVALALAVGCGQASTSAPPASTAAATTKPTEPARAPTQATSRATEATNAPAQASSVPTKMSQFPEKGKAITILVGYPAGGAVDLGARILAPLMEKELGTPVVVVNKPGASSQVALTELVRAKPDGYTAIAVSLPAAILTYLDPERKAIYSAKDFLPIGNMVWDPEAIAVKADSPYKSLQDLITAAKAKPEAIKFGTAGLGNPDHMGIISLEKKTSAKFGVVHFDGNPAALSAMLGGHVDATHLSMAFQVSPVKSGQTRILAINDREESRFFPGVKTAVAQGVDHVVIDTRGLAVPAGTPKDIADILSNAMKKAVQSDEMRARMDEMGLGLRYMDQAEYSAHWAEKEAQTKAVIGELRK